MRDWFEWLVFWFLWFQKEIRDYGQMAVLTIVLMIIVYQIMKYILN